MHFFRIAAQAQLMLIMIVAAQDQASSNKRIIDGKAVSIRHFPYQVSIEIQGVPQCGGAILHQRIIITAAHCVGAFRGLKLIPTYVLAVRAGTSFAGYGGEVFAVRDLAVHESFYNKFERDVVDIALLLLQTSINYNYYAQPVKISPIQPRPGSFAVATGYGSQIAQQYQMPKQRTPGDQCTAQEAYRLNMIIKPFPNITFEYQQSQRYFLADESDRRLMAVPLVIVDTCLCRLILGSRRVEVGAGMICASSAMGRGDTCGGDSGGPLVVGNRLIGITSYGLGCGEIGLPAVYANVVGASYWLRHTARQLLSTLYYY